ncbi:methylated-DNA--[protein]-cysteine S-methyltransferase [Planosporangium mesophilum]|nr:methylated-DNA--[protein]-cysteine S-methyltransferase [Planosporangium mesophilum]NJC82243.1 methylated-DNA--[protein]-cysteine S-methyltransferase [Planosporangium mesophilum]
MRWIVLSTPVGDLSVASAREAICRVEFGRVDARPGRAEGVDDAVLAAATAQLEEYFAGRRTAFELPLAEVGGSEFERAVRAELSRIPYGEMRTYGQVATAVGDPGAARAVGTACNRNPLPVLVPCHRVVGAGGKLVGFGGGLPRKRVLLELEARVRVERDFAP